MRAQVLAIRLTWAPLSDLQNVVVIALASALDSSAYIRDEVHLFYHTRSSTAAILYSVLNV